MAFHVSGLASRRIVTRGGPHPTGASRIAWRIRASKPSPPVIPVRFPVPRLLGAEAMIPIKVLAPTASHVIARRRLDCWFIGNSGPRGCGDDPQRH
jgi:hypothetical protein